MNPLQKQELFLVGAKTSREGKFENSIGRLTRPGQSNRGHVSDGLIQSKK